MTHHSGLAASLMAAVVLIAWPDMQRRAQGNDADESAAAKSKDPLLAGFRDPPVSARPSTYWLWLNGYVNREHIRHELEQFRRAGISGVCLFDMGARGPKEMVPPAGPAFMSDQSVRDIAHAVRVAGELNMSVQLSVSSSWDMGGSWVEPQHASMGLYHAEMSVEGPSVLDGTLPFPPIPANAPRHPDGKPVYWKDVAVLAIPATTRLPGHQFVFQLDPPGIHTLDHVVLYNTASDGPRRDGPTYLPAKDFSVAVSATEPEEGAFREVLRASLQPTAEAQRFDLPRPEARYVRLRILSGHDPNADRLQLGEFEVWSTDGVNVAASHSADRTRDGAVLLGYSSALGHDRDWTADNIHDGAKGGPGGSWSSAGPPPLVIQDVASIVDLTDKVDSQGRLTWNVPAGKWIILRFVCTNTGERLKVPSPASDGLATDHLSGEATRHFIQHLITRLRAELPDLENTALKQLYLASYEVRGPIWTPDLVEQFRRYRHYDMTPYLPALVGCTVGNEGVTQRFIYDYRKTLGDLLVDAYYRTARDTAHSAGLGIESEAGGPGPPIHQVPVDALKALGSIDEIRGEFWPKRPDAHRLWVVKETACAGHIYGRQRVHMEAFTSFHHWQDGPFDLKPSADRAFCEGANHFVWHTASHLPPESGKPGWVYGAGTHLNTNLVWWPKAKPFIDYLSRCSFMLQQGLFVGDVCYYYGDQGFNFVPPKHVDPSLGPGYDYDVTNAEVLLARMNVREGKLVLPDGMSYQLLVLPDRQDMDLDVLRKVEQLVRAGATVVGPKPVRSNGLTGYPDRDEQVRQLADQVWGPCDGTKVLTNAYGRGRVIWGRRLRDVLRERGIGPDFSYLGRRERTDLDYIHRRTDQADIYFVRNKGLEWEQVDAVFRVVGKAPEFWLPDSGEVHRQTVFRPVEGGIQVPLRLAPGGSLFVVFRRALDAPHVRSVFKDDRPVLAPAETEVSPLPSAELLGGGAGQIRLLAFERGTYRLEVSDGRVATAVVDHLPTAQPLTGPWRVRFPTGWGAPDSATFESLMSWTDHADEGVRYFSGIASYERQFDLPADWLKDDGRVFLDLGRLWAVGEVHVNDQSLGVIWKPPFRVDVTRAARPGKNRLVVEVANTWSNRLAGDARSTDGKKYCRTNIQNTGGKSWATTPLLESGLLGPVQLIPATVATATF